MPSLRWLLLGLIVLAAFWLRGHDLDRRPMHADEANQAVKLGELLDAGRYAFDPRDHHGPTLYYAAVPLAWLRGQRSLVTLTETTVRLVPALFGTATVVLMAFLAAGVLSAGSTNAATSTCVPSWPGLAAAALCAVSPPAVYYSRYFIQETLLVTFTLGFFLAARAWWRGGLTRWVVAAGVFAGLMQATKATAPLFIVAAGVAFLLARAKPPTASRPNVWRALGVGLVAALVTAALLYSSFGTHPRGMLDAVGAYGHAGTRFGADAGPTGHEKPWWFYLRIFGWYREGLVWHQAVFSTFAIAGIVVAVLGGNRTLRWAAAYSLILFVIFSTFSYKTPWHAVHFVPAMALLAAGALAALTRLRTGRFLGASFALLALVTLFQQAWRTSFLRAADFRNPYAYVHSSADVLKFRPLVDASLAQRPDLPITVVSEEYWPLPWYLRGLPRVGYWATPPERIPRGFVIASSTHAEAVRPMLQDAYRESILGLRPGFVCVLFTPEP